MPSRHRSLGAASPPPPASLPRALVDAGDDDDKRYHPNAYERVRVRSDYSARAHLASTRSNCVNERGDEERAQRRKPERVLERVVFGHWEPNREERHEHCGHRPLGSGGDIADDALKRLGDSLDDGPLEHVGVIDLAVDAAWPLRLTRSAHLSPQLKLCGNKLMCRLIAMRNRLARGFHSRSVRLVPSKSPRRNKLDRQPIDTVGKSEPSPKIGYLELSA